MASGRDRRGVAAMRRLGRRVSLRNYTLLLVLAVVWLVFQVLTKGIFLSQRNLTLMALQTCITALAAISAVLLIITRNFDISVGSAVALVGVVSPWLTVEAGCRPARRGAVAMAVGLAWAPGTVVGDPGRRALVHRDPGRAALLPGHLDDRHQRRHRVAGAASR